MSDSEGDVRRFTVGELSAIEHDVDEAMMVPPSEMLDLHWLGLVKDLARELRRQLWEEANG